MFRGVQTEFVTLIEPLWWGSRASPGYTEPARWSSGSEKAAAMEYPGPTRDVEITLRSVVFPSKNPCEGPSQNLVFPA